MSRAVASICVLKEVMIKTKIGLLPLYLELYDRISKPGSRKPFEEFYETIAKDLARRGTEVIRVPVCRAKREFRTAVKTFEKARVDAIITLHLAYSPSLESAGVLASTKLPVIVLDTTPDYDFSPLQSPDKIMFNHGIHGVQDMCNLMIRNGKPFFIEAGHWRRSDVIDRALGQVLSARMASTFGKSRVGRIGKPFAGMGDFLVAGEALKKMGIMTIVADCRQLGRAARNIAAHEVKSEISANLRECTTRDGISKAHERSVRTGLAVRRWVERERLTAFTFNFGDLKRSSGLPAVPFLEASIGMASGIGYAGEGDVLTAALVGALLSVYPETTFTEMFCPDWKNEMIFLSHMGEVNSKLLAGKPALVELPFIFGELDNPVKVAGRLRGGPAVFVNLAPLSGNRFRLILAQVCMARFGGSDRFADSVRGWMKPPIPLADFLAAYSRAGGTHHAALAYDADIGVLSGFGHLMGWETVVIGR